MDRVIKDCGLIDMICKHLKFKSENFIDCVAYPEFISFQFKGGKYDILADVSYKDIQGFIYDEQEPDKRHTFISKIYHTIIKEKTEGKRIESELP